MAIKNFTGGVVLVSHDMRLIDQVAEQIWVCDNKTVEKFPGDIADFKKKLQVELGLREAGDALKGDASEKKKVGDEKKKKVEAPKKSGISVAKTGPSPVNTPPPAPAGPAAVEPPKASGLWGKEKQSGAAPSPSAASGAYKARGGSSLSFLEKRAAAPAPAPAPAAAAAAPAAGGGACSQVGKCEWRMCDECGKRHP